MSATIIDDQDKSVSYTGTWVVGGTANEHAGTVSSSLKVGDRFSVPFTGTKIGVYGTFDASSAGVKTSYAIDGGRASTVTSPASGKDSFKQLFWQSDALTPGPHELVVTMVAVNNVGDGEGTVWFDYFSASGSSETSAPASSPPPITSGKATKTPTGSSPGASDSGLPIVPAKKSNSTTIGAAVAVVILLIVAGLLFIFYRRRRRYQRSARPVSILPAAQPGPYTQPFLSNNPSTPPMSSFPGSPQAFPSSYANAPPSNLSSPSMSSYPGTPQPLASPYPNPHHAYNAHNAPSLASSYAPGPGPAAFDPYSQSGAPYNQMPGSHGHYDAYAAHARPGTPSTRAPSGSTSSGPSRPTLSAVGGPRRSEDYSDSIAALKQRQKQVVDSYEQGVSSGSHYGQPGPLVQHTDSGARALDPAAPAVELPPVYTPN
ncbi:hypothetical protein C8J57DRAFT_361033 [Mycena rebaudengoi]|nr:hypothetical protein C8J57DRAFT_361033 [Mycena rebaudengoi]